MKMNEKTKRFYRGISKATRKKIDPWDWYYANSKGREISYANFDNYIRKLSKKELAYMFQAVSYNKRAEKKQLRRDGCLADYYDYLF